MASLHNLIKVGEEYDKKHLSEIIGVDLTNVREGIFSVKKYNSIILFTDLVKTGKEERFHFNDYFEGDYFHWDSQPRQNINSTQIKKIVNGEVEINLFARIEQKVKGKTQPFKYCGRLQYSEYDINTSNPVHLICFNLDYDETNSELKEIYEWKPEKVGKRSTNNTYLPNANNSTKSKKHTKPNLTERSGLIISRVGQGYYRQEVLDKWEHKCAVTALELSNILIASHILPWKDASDDERLDPENGILLSPTLDALFDKYLISFDDEGKIILSNKLDLAHLSILGINPRMKLREVTKGMLKYLEKHRQFLSK